MMDDSYERATTLGFRCAYDSGDDPTHGAAEEEKEKAATAAAKLELETFVKEAVARSEKGLREARLEVEAAQTEKDAAAAALKGVLNGLIRRGRAARGRPVKAASA